MVVTRRPKMSRFDVSFFYVLFLFVGIYELEFYGGPEFTLFEIMNTYIHISWLPTHNRSII